MYLLGDVVIADIVNSVDDLDIVEKICKSINSKLKRIERVQTDCVMLVLTAGGNISVFLLAESHLPVEMRIIVKEVKDSTHIIKPLQRVYNVNDFVERIDDNG